MLKDSFSLASEFSSNEKLNSAFAFLNPTRVLNLGPAQVVFQCR